MSDLKNKYYQGNGALRRSAKRFLVKFQQTRPFLGKLFLLSVTILAIIMGINSNIISQYEDATQKEFNWLNPNDILKFPIEQLKYNYSTRVETLKLNNKNTDSLHFMFLLDRTASSMSAPAGVSKNSKGRFMEDIKDDFGDDFPKLDGFDYQTLMCLSMIKYIIKDVSPYYENVKITAAYNDGLQDLVFVGVDKTKTINDKNTLISIIKEFKKCEDKKNENSPDTTYFDDVFQELLNESSKYPNFQNILTIMSDFGHDTSPDGTHSYEQIPVVLRKFSNDIQMNLIKYPLTKAAEKNKNLGYRPNKLINDIASIFKSTYVYYFNINDFEVNYDQDQKLSKIKEFVTPTFSSSEKDIYMIYPDINIHKNGISHAAVELDIYQGNGINEFFISSSTLPVGDQLANLEYEINNPFQKGQLTPNFSTHVEVNDGQTLKLKHIINESFEGVSQLDIFSEALRRKIRYNIKVVERTSLTIAQLIFSLASVALLSLLGFMVLILVHLRDKLFYNVTILSLGIGVFIYFILPLFSLPFNEQGFYILFNLLIYFCIGRLGILLYDIDNDSYKNKLRGYLNA